jgi:alginate O-acetyltransferase complex protein AlgJ
MNPATTTSTLRRWTNVILIALFMALLWLPGLDSVFHFDWTPPRSENRAIAAYPKFQPGWHGMQAYVVGLEAYFNDHFGCRKCLVQWNNKLRWSLFKEQNTRGVLVGKDGWLFMTEAQMIDHYSGQLQFTPTQLHDWQVLLEKRRDWLARRGIPYLFVVAPDKQTIYPEDLPDWITKVRPQTKLDQFFTYMHAHSTVPVLDLRNVVRDAKQMSPTYLKTDTHWNFIGGFAAYQELVQTLAHQVPAMKLEPMPLASFRLTNWLTPGGDLARILGLSMSESNAYFLMPNPELPQFITKLPPPDHPKEPAFSNNPKVKGNLILFHDSFAGAWIPFLGYHFNRITYLWQYDLDPVWIERDKPDVVVTEMLERFFNISDPKKMMAKEALN